MNACGITAVSEAIPTTGQACGQVTEHRVPRALHDAPLKPVRETPGVTPPISQHEESPVINKTNRTAQSQSDTHNSKRLESCSMTIHRDQN
jgi:hypothetical protein